MSSRIKPAWVSYEIDDDDVRFIERLIEEIQPPEVVEIGVCAGWSSLIILCALPAGAKLYSFDTATQCLYDLRYPVGKAVYDAGLPDIERRWELTQGDAGAAGTRLKRHGIRLGMIDANHRHPYAALDLIQMLPALADAAWVILHDVRMPIINNTEYDWGPRNLFMNWPEALRRESATGHHRNIGAVRLPTPKEDCLEWICKMLYRSCMDKEVAP